VNASNVRRPLTRALILAGALLLPMVASRGWADSENWCPGSPWNCIWWRSCTNLQWCAGGTMPCSILMAGWTKYKYLIVKQCTNTETGAQLYCNSCGAQQNGPSCCMASTPEPECPNGSSCP
jgi:hypothetical protein